ncbi:hypothetical protein QTN25_005349 [Entamoeba marina]
MNCANIKEINICCVNSIGGRCFENCTLLELITLNLCLNKLKRNTFFNCKSLKKIEYFSELINNSQLSIKKYGESCFERCESIVVIEIPDSVDFIGNCCFKGCTSLTAITFSSSIKIIKNETCKQCSSLKYVNLPHSLTSICNDCFSGCSSLKYINLPPLLTSIGNDCFSRCASLEEIKLPEEIKFIGQECFSYCGLKNIVIPSSVTDIGNNILADCNSLTSITFKNNKEILTLKMTYSDYKFFKIFGIKCSNVIYTEYDVMNDMNINEQNYNNSFILPDNITDIHDYAFNQKKY